MDNLSAILSNYDEIVFTCPIHNLPSIGLCSEFLSKNVLLYEMYKIK